MGAIRNVDNFCRIVHDAYSDFIHTGNNIARFAQRRIDWAVVEFDYLPKNDLDERCILKFKLNEDPNLVFIAYAQEFFKAFKGMEKVTYDDVMEIKII